MPTVNTTWQRPSDSNYWPKRTIEDVATADREMQYWLEVEKALGPHFKLHGWTGVDRGAFWYNKDGYSGGGGFWEPVEVHGQVANILVPQAIPKK